MEKGEQKLKENLLSAIISPRLNKPSLLGRGKLRNSVLSCLSLPPYILSPSQAALWVSYPLSISSC